MPAHAEAVLGLRHLALLFVVGCSRTDGERPPIQLDDGRSTEKLVATIQLAAKRIDAANAAAEAAGGTLTRELPHWQFSGLFESSKPIFLSAVFSQGRLVREETYYLVGGKLSLVRVHRWWDVDDPKEAPEPATQQAFYIENDQTIRRVFDAAAGSPLGRSDDSTQPASTLAARSRSITQILLGGAEAAAAAEALELFPDAAKP